jgi:hypothetical protein
MDGNFASSASVRDGVSRERKSIRPKPVCRKFGFCVAPAGAPLFILGLLSGLLTQHAKPRVPGARLRAGLTSRRASGAIAEQGLKFGAGFNAQVLIPPFAAITESRDLCISGGGKGWGTQLTYIAFCIACRRWMMEPAECLITRQINVSAPTVISQ